MRLPFKDSNPTEAIKMRAISFPWAIWTVWKVKESPFQFQKNKKTFKKRQFFLAVHELRTIFVLPVYKRTPCAYPSKVFVVRGLLQMEPVLVLLRQAGQHAVENVVVPLLQKCRPCIVGRKKNTTFPIVFYIPEDFDALFLTFPGGTDQPA
jgi:hypothetical protein